ncbi:MAG: dTMP kinase [Candidatus Aenigmarchaeota archaeon]|nr:dTMP kinase [Candidatus Aenigmarchaeota archaeon]
MAVGKFIVFEGLDGSGITTQSTLLRNYFMNKGRDALLTKEPTDGLIGGMIKACLRKEWKTTPLTLQMLFASDRAHHLSTEIEPALKKGKIVICDRYILSSIVYGSLSVPTATLKQLNAEFKKPAATIFIDTQPRICIERIKKARHHIELFEEEQRLEQIRRNYLALKNYFPETCIVDGNRVPEEVLNDIIKAVGKI